MNIILIPIAIIFLIIGGLLLNTLRLQRKPDIVEEAPQVQVDKATVSEHLAQAIRHKTISSHDMVEDDHKTFLELHDWIRRTYPMVAEKLEKEVINDLSLLYTWRGSDPKLKAVLLNAHMDVVPAEEQTLKDWKFKPFDGVIQNGFVWGRGALDMKCTLVGILEAVEMLLQAGFSPHRTIYLAFGHDEEIMGQQGTVRIVDHLKAKQVQLAAVLDEGGMISLGSLEGIDEPVALIGNSEKGYLTMKLTAEGKPGHSSRPPRQTAIGMIARAIALMDDHPMPARLDCFLPTLKNIGFMMPFGLQMVIANSWLFKKIMIKRLEKKPETNALLRTTHAATMVTGGIKDNVLPASASAAVNLRLLQGDSIDDVFSYFRKIINDPRINMEIDKTAGGWEASEVSSTDTPPYRSLELVVRQIFNNVPVAPFVFLAATDSRYYQPVCSNIYKFSPHILTPEEQRGVHGVDERISQDSLVKMTAFYHRLIQVWGEAGF